ncbi:ribosomal protection-like ABC-F family protein [Fannyhessea vaginae]|uniref:ribosomal protection-like ABC-F family protein n=1 Tax=Fannyhessea vaginae TaxID=82135 RepID=UPI003A80B530
MIRIDNLTKVVGARTLFAIDHLSIGACDKVGLIGDNGTGKTTFLRILSSLDTDYAGRVQMNDEISYLLNNLEDELGFIYQRRFQQNCSSPGEQQRLKLEHLLVDNKAFLLIDEPTSHLDIKQRKLLAKRLHARNKGFILVSHDRDFINQTCTKIFELVNGKIEVYSGDYSFYLCEREKKYKCAEREYESYVKEKKRLLQVANAIKQQSAKVKTTPKRMGNSEARLHKMGGQQNKKKLDKQVKATLERVNQLEVKSKPYQNAAIKLNMDEREKIHSKVLIRAENLNKSFDSKVIFKNVNFTIDNTNKVALLGDNGSGKTTLLNMILNGETWTHPNLRIGYYSQLGETLDYTKTILDNVLLYSIYDQSMTRIILARLGFKTNDVFKQVNVLSDGEKAKVKLAKLLTGNFNYLVMDEPTNFLDIRAIEALEELLQGYDRPLLFVTHDASFINNVADSLLLIENEKITAFEGNLQQYNEENEV